MITAKIDKGQLVLTLPLEAPRASATGKTLTVASTRGFAPVGIEVDGKPVKVSVQAYVKP